MSGLIFQYGGYRHQAGEAYPQMIEIRPVYSQRGIRWASDIRFQIGGSFCRDPSNPLDPADTGTLIEQMDNAYLHDYSDFGFLYADGTTKTPHYLYNDAPFNLSGNKVLGRSWTYQTPAEFANTRSYSISLGARVLESYSQILYFKETIRLVGNGGAKWDYRTRWQGAPIRENISQQTPVHVIQRGTVITTTGIITAPAPWWPDDEVGEDRVIERIGPDQHGHLSFSRATHYGLEYSYHFRMATSPAQQPSIWYP